VDFLKANVKGGIQSVGYERKLLTIGCLSDYSTRNHPDNRIALAIHGAISEHACVPSS
jgi:hypothetical protein